MEGTLAEVRMFAGNFAPRGWMLCQGQLLSIAQWTAVFALMGTTYGGNGQTTFALPNFSGRVAVGTGQGSGLPNTNLGDMAGSSNITLSSFNLPAHNHMVIGTVTPQVNNDGANLTDDANGARLGASGQIFTTAATDLVNMAPIPFNITSGIAGGSQPLNIVPPYLGMNFVICVEGIFPSRN